mmetsp:Transcript_64291/g.73808  ORF Transcript_64291/g.73808 Transcript_64291/m.73808 type:complete len:94 (-) Transcript_64291:704-985(-)
MTMRLFRRRKIRREKRGISNLLYLSLDGFFIRGRISRYHSSFDPRKETKSGSVSGWWEFRRIFGQIFGIPTECYKISPKTGEDPQNLFYFSGE